VAQNRARIPHAGSGSAPQGPTSGAQGTLGGRVQGIVGSKPGKMQLRIGDEGYLWLLIALEVGAMAWLRQAFRRHHGG
jgi:hypothetical protein